MTQIMFLLILLFFNKSTTSTKAPSSASTIAEVQYQMRTEDILGFGPSNEPLMIKSEWRRNGMEQVFSTKFKIIRTFELQNFLIRFERCRDLELGCEDFQTWNITPTLLCQSLKMKNQMWSALVESIKPKTLFQNCPRLRLKQGIYRMENVTVATDQVMKFYNEAVKYYWKVHGIYYNLTNEVEMRTFFRSYFVKYTKRDRVNI